MLHDALNYPFGIRVSFHSLHSENFIFEGNRRRYTAMASPSTIIKQQWASV